MTKVKTAFPKLRFFSMLKNPACPNTLMVGDEDDYKRYRHRVIFMIQDLKFLDSTPVMAAELKEAKRVGPYLKVARLEEPVSLITLISANLHAKHLCLFCFARSQNHRKRRRRRRKSQTTRTLAPCQQTWPSTGSTGGPLGYPSMCITAGTRRGTDSFATMIFEHISFLLVLFSFFLFLFFSC